MNLLAPFNKGQFAINYYYFFKNTFFFTIYRNNTLFQGFAKIIRPRPGPNRAGPVGQTQAEQVVDKAGPSCHQLCQSCVACNRPRRANELVGLAETDEAL